MKPLATAAAIAMLLQPAGCYELAYGQTATLGPHNSNPLPPLEYDYPFNGPTIIVRGDEKLMREMCPKSMYPVTLGCQYFLSLPGTVSPTPLGKACIIIVAKDEILKETGWKYEDVKRHERGHCNGWSASHPGQRPLGSPEKKDTVSNYRQQ